MLDLVQMRRTLIFVLVLGLMGWGLQPVLACMPVSSTLAEYGNKAPCCVGMKMGVNIDDAQFIAAPDTSCCFVSKAPVPESQYELSDSSLTSAPVAASEFNSESLQVQFIQPVIPVRGDVSPPAFQSLLCTFLI
jgi:hypothetical protein